MEGCNNVKSISSTMGIEEGQETGGGGGVEVQNNSKRRTLKHDQQCGLECIKLPCLQPLAHPVVFISVVCVFFAFYVCAMGGYFGGILSTLERRFQLSSAEMGSIAIIGKLIMTCLCRCRNNMIPRKWIANGDFEYTPYNLPIPANIPGVYQLPQKMKM